MDISASEWSSGCESGWTLYFDESSQSLNPFTPKSLHHHTHQSLYRSNADEEEDLSMVSDASSGPPLTRYEDQVEDDIACYRQAGFYYPPSTSEKSKKSKAKKEPARLNHHHSFLDDTASSTSNRLCMDPSSNQPSIDQFFGFSQGNGFQGNSGFGEQLGFWPQGRQQDSAEPSRSRGRRRG